VYVTFISHSDVVKVKIEATGSRNEEARLRHLLGRGKMISKYGRKVEAKARYRTGNKARTKSNHNSFVSETCLETSQNLHYYIID